VEKGEGEGSCGGSPGGYWLCLLLVATLPTALLATWPLGSYMNKREGEEG
jgi:hypothetical protein